MTRPSISVVVPVYNGEALLADGIQSIRDQNVGDLETIVVDDGSTDGTADIALRHTDVIYVLRSNGGPSAARNTGAAIASGDFLCFFDHDDLMLPGKLARQRDHLEAHPEADCVLTHWRTVLLEGARPYPGHAYERGIGFRGVAPISAMFRASAFRSADGFDESYRIGEDVEILSRMTLAGARVDVIDEVLLEHRIHGRNLSYERAWGSKSLATAIKARLDVARTGSSSTAQDEGFVDGLVSVVMSVFNGEKYVADALESILSQDYGSFEVIVVDDGSTDATGEIVRSFEGVTYVRQPNRQLAAARQAGLELARGEFVCFFDHDDKMKSDKLSKQVAYLRSHPDVDAVLARQELMVEEGGEEAKWIWRDPVYGDPGGVQPESALFRTSALVGIGGWHPEKWMVGAMDVLGRLRDAGGRIEVLGEVVMERRIHDSNMTHDIPALQTAMLQSFKDRLDARRARPADPRK